MRKPKTAPLAIGTPVAIDIAQGLSVAQGIVVAAEYDEGWRYRIDVTGGDECREHRDEADELWVCDFELQPIGTVPTAKR